LERIFEQVGTPAHGSKPRQAIDGILKEGGSLSKTGFWPITLVAETANPDGVLNATRKTCTAHSGGTINRFSGLANSSGGR